MARGFHENHPSGLGDLSSARIRGRPFVVPALRSAACPDRPGKGIEWAFSVVR